jgi:hypothetical protein
MVQDKIVQDWVYLVKEFGLSYVEVWFIVGA